MFQLIVQYISLLVLLVLVLVFVYLASSIVGVSDTVSCSQKLVEVTVYGASPHHGLQEVHFWYEYDMIRAKVCSNRAHNCGWFALCLGGVGGICITCT